jgi:hypothetical protein
MAKVRVPGVRDIATAIRMYYEKHELTSSDIVELFGVCMVTAKRLKDMARDLMGERDVPNWNALAVNTDCAFEAWGLDIDDLERRYKKLLKYGMVGNEKPNNRQNAREAEGMLELPTPQTTLPRYL